SEEIVKGASFGDSRRELPASGQQVIGDEVNLLLGQFGKHRQAQAFLGPGVGLRERTVGRRQIAIGSQPMNRKRIVDPRLHLMLLEPLQLRSLVRNSDRIEMVNVLAS